MKNSFIFVIHSPAMSFGMSQVWNALRAANSSCRLQITRNTLHQIIYSPQSLNWNLKNLLPTRYSDLSKFRAEISLH